MTMTIGSSGTVAVADRRAGQVSISLKRLDEAITRLESQSFRLLESVDSALQPEMARLDGSNIGVMPESEPTAPLSIDLEGFVTRLDRVTYSLSSGADRAQL